MVYEIFAITESGVTNRYIVGETFARSNFERKDAEISVDIMNFII